jgi:hypothetical protein
LTGIQFPLTNFPHVDQTWESGENGFQKNEFLETNRALVKRERMQVTITFPHKVYV